MKANIYYGIEDDEHETISATEVVRNFSAAIDKVRYSGISLYITKGSKTIAELNPPPKRGFPTNKLSALFNSLPDLGQDADSFSNDMQDTKNDAVLPENPWES